MLFFWRIFFFSLLQHSKNLHPSRLSEICVLQLAGGISNYRVRLQTGQQDSVPDSCKKLYSSPKSQDQPRLLSNELLRTAVKWAELEADQFHISNAEFKNVLSTISILVGLRACSVPIILIESYYNRGNTEWGSVGRPCILWRIRAFRCICVPCSQ
jgi:hypothetical protein